MVGQYQVEANHRNKAKTGGGPRTVAGKSRSRYNALKHGLSVPIGADRHLRKSVLGLAHMIAGEGASDPMLAQALIIAECELTLQRIHQARVTAIENTMANNHNETQTAGATETAAAFAKALPTLCGIERYERRACSRRKNAQNRLDDLQLMAQFNSG
jgi:hypothetical protein